MVAVRTEVLGVKELTGYFRALAREAPGKLTAGAVRDGAEVILKAAKDNIRSKLTERSGDLLESGQVVLVNQFRADIRFGMVYAAAHEYGLPNQAITHQQRNFFWFQFMRTGDLMWKWLALSQTYTIPMRAYLRPAIDSHQRAAVDVMAKTLRHEMVKMRPKAITVVGTIRF